MKKHLSLRLLIPLLALLLLSLILIACQGAGTDEESQLDTVTESAGNSESAETTDTESETDGESESSPESDSETESETESETYEIHEEIIGNIRIQLYSASVLRVEQSLDGAFFDEQSIAVTNRTDWPGVPVERIEEDGTIRLVTPAYTVVIPSTTPTARSITVLDPDGKNLWTYRSSENAVAHLPAPADTPRAWAFNDNPRVTIPENGFTEIREGEADNGFSVNAKTADYYIFVCKEDAMQLRADYNRLVGPCDMVTVKTLGLWFSRFYAYKDTDLQRLVRDYRRRGYPLDYVVVDTDWRVGSSTGYDINTALFPDMETFLASMHQQNISIAFNDHVRDYAGSMLSPEQLTWFNENLTAKLEIGLDTWWYDRNWHYTLKSPLAAIHGDMLGQMMYQSIMQAYNAPLNRRTVMLSNYYTDVHSRLTLPAYIGTHRYSVQWSGDITPSVLPAELENMVKLGALTSSAYISSDIGGHLYSPSDEMFIRWTQYGSLSPIMRYHSSSADRSPWMHGQLANRVALNYINMRYRLMPLFYTLAYENHADGLPIARRLDFYYPQYKEAAANDQYLLGEDILVAPITEGDRPLDPTWLTAPDGRSGVEISYYNNPTLSGNPVKIEHADAIDFDWGTGSPGSGIPADNFSASISATLTVGDYDIHLGTISDDGVRVYIDGQRVIDFWQASDSSMQLNKNVTLKANTAYDLRVEYYEIAGGARLQLLAISANLTASADQIVTERSVFIPDGEWMDVFSGQIYKGPQTITVAHGLQTSPIFIRKGSILALAHKSEYADTDQWERLVLDVYPAEGTSDTSILYEDDGASLDYQNGQYRKTRLTTATKDGKTAITIAGAKGDYTTDWTEREWTVRLHVDSIKSVKVNGESVDFTVVQADTSAAPFAAEGASPDGNVAVFTFRSDLYTSVEITVE